MVAQTLGPQGNLNLKKKQCSICHNFGTRMSFQNPICAFESPLIGLFKPLEGILCPYERQNEHGNRMIN